MHWSPESMPLTAAPACIVAQHLTTFQSQPGILSFGVSGLSAGLSFFTLPTSSLASLSLQLSASVASSEKSSLTILGLVRFVKDILSSTLIDFPNRILTHPYWYIHSLIIWKNACTPLWLDAIFHSASLFTHHSTPRDNMEPRVKSQSYTFCWFQPLNSWRSTGPDIQQNSVEELRKDHRRAVWASLPWRKALDQI